MISVEHDLNNEETTEKDESSSQVVQHVSVVESMGGVENDGKQPANLKIFTNPFSEKSESC